jgi:hypothetical protein
MFRHGGHGGSSVIQRWAVAAALLLSCGAGGRPAGAATASMVVDLNTTAAAGDPSHSSIASLLPLGGRLLFIGGHLNQQLWASDGTFQGTAPIFDFCPTTAQYRKMMPAALLSPSSRVTSRSME